MKRGISLLLCLLLAVGMVCSATGCGEEDPPRKEVSEQEDKAKEVEEVRNTCRVYYESHFVKDTDIALCADVTGDQIPELIVVRFDRQEGCIAGEVFTCVDGKMKKIHSKGGGFDHVHSFFSWYLAPNGKNSFYLVEETHGMWQGSGVITARMYQLDKDGKEKEIQYKELSSSDESVTVETSSAMGYEITQEAWDAYVKDVQKMVKGGYIIYSNASNCDLLRVLSHPDKSFYLTDLRELASPTFEHKENNTTSEAESAVTPENSKKPTSPVDRPHVDTVDAAFWRDAEAAIKAWKRAYIFGGALCDLEWQEDSVKNIDVRDSDRDRLASEIQDKEDRERFMEQTRARDCVAISRCCHTYEEVKAHNQKYLSKSYLKEWFWGGDRAIGEQESPVFEINGEIWVVYSTSKPGFPEINTTSPRFDFSNPNRPEVTVYNPEMDSILIYTFAFVKENGKYKIDGADSEWIKDGVNFQQLKDDLSEHYTVSGDFFNPVFMGNYTVDSPVWICVPVEGNDVDSILVNLTTGEACEAICGSDEYRGRYSWNNYTFIGPSFYVPISW